MPRTLILHFDGSINDKLIVRADDPGPGGAPRRYQIDARVADVASTPLVELNFAQADAVGVTNEALLAVLIDRLAGFQSGPCACHENAEALQHCQEALAVLGARTRRRAKAGLANQLQEREAVVALVEGCTKLRVGATKLPAEPLRTSWMAWDEVAKILRADKPTLSAMDWAVLESIPKNNAAMNGYRELLAAFRKEERGERTEVKLEGP